MRSQDFERITWSAPVTSRPLLDPSPTRALRQLITGAACALACVAAGYGCAQVTAPDTVAQHTTTAR